MVRKRNSYRVDLTPAMHTHLHALAKENSTIPAALMRTLVLWGFENEDEWVKRTLHREGPRYIATPLGSKDEDLDLSLQRYGGKYP